MKTVLVIFSIFLVSAFAQKYEGVKLSIFYESLSAESQQFITKQLFPNYEQLKDYIELNLIPFGLTKQKQNGNSWFFQCTKGKEECFGNKMHSCAFNLAKNSQDNRMDFANCVMSSENPSDLTSVAKKCSSTCGINYEDLKSCTESADGDELLALNGQRTLSVSPAIASVPSLTFNGNNNPVLTQKSLGNFLQTMCQILANPPASCN